MANPSPQPTDLIETEAEPKAQQAEEDRLLDEAEAEAERVGTIQFEEVEAWVRSFMAAKIPSMWGLATQQSSIWREQHDNRRPRHEYILFCSRPYDDAHADIFLVNVPSNLLDGHARAPSRPIAR
jgi:hypothetical protein